MNNLPDLQTNLIGQLEKIALEIDQKELAEAFRQSDFCKTLADNMHEATGFNRAICLITVRVLAWLVLKNIEKGVEWLQSKLFADFIAVLLKFPKLDQIIAFLNARLKNYQAELGFKSFLTNGNALTDKELEALPLGIWANYKQIQGLDELKDIIEQGFLQQLDFLNPPLSWFQKSPQRSRFYFANQEMPFVKREEQQRLQLFLLDSRYFAWQLIEGSGGCGKSRLALQLLQDNAVFYDGGFYDFKEEINWNTWQPAEPTIIVVDYAAGKATQARSACEILTRRAYNHTLNFPVRLLLIERVSENSQWWKNFFTDQPDEISPSQYAAPIRLSEVSNRIISEKIFSLKISNKRQEEKALESLIRIDSQLRPLFALFISEALSQNKDCREWDQQCLLDFVQAHEVNRVFKGLNARAEDLILLALASICGGFDLDDLPALASSHKFLPQRENISQDCYPIAAKEGKFTILAIEPDIVGEFFVLNRIMQLQNDASHAPTVDALRQIAWQQKPFGTALFVLRCLQDFAQDDKFIPSIKPLLKAPRNPTTQQIWAMAVIDFVSLLGVKGQLPKAAELYRELEDLAKDGDKEIRVVQAEAAFNLINACGNAGDMPQAQELYRELEDLAKDGDEEIRVVQAKAAVNLINDYGNAGELLQAQELYRELQDLAKDGDEEIRLEQAKAAFNLIYAFGNAGDMPPAQELYRELQDLAKDGDEEIRVVQAEAAYNLITDYGKSGELPQAQELYRELQDLAKDGDKEIRVEQAKSAYNLINDYGNAGKLPQAQELYRELQGLAKDGKKEIRVVQAEAAYNLINAFGNAGELPQAQELYRELEDLAKDGDEEIRIWQAKAAFNLITFFGKAGDMPQAQELYRELQYLAKDGNKEIRVEQAKAAFNLISAYGNAGELPLAQELYRELQGLAKDGDEEIRVRQAKAAVNLISAYGKAGEMAQAQELYRELQDLAKDGKKEIRVEQAKAAVNLIYDYGNAGELQKAQELYRELQDLAKDGDEEIRVLEAKATFNLINAFAKAGELQKAQELYRELRDLAKDGDEEIRVVQAKSAYNLIYYYGKSGEMAKAQELYRELQDLAKDGDKEIRVVQASAAYNLIYVYGKAGELPQAQELYRELEDLAKDGKKEIRVVQAEAANLLKNFALSH